MDWWQIVLLLWGISVILYAFRLSLKYFTYLEGTIRNGTIITTAIGAGLIWLVTLALDGIRGVWEEIGPVKQVQIEETPTHEGPFLPDVTRPLSVEEMLKANATENLADPRVQGMPTR